MRTHILTLLAGILVLLIPTGAAAQVYLGPDDVLFLNNQSQRVNRRNAERLVEEREAKNATVKKDDRPTVKDWWEVSADDETAGAGTEEVVTPHLSAPPEPKPVVQPKDEEPEEDAELHSGAPGKGKGDVDNITLRRLLRLNNQTYIPTPTQHVIYKPSYLSHTGPESVLMVLAMIPTAILIVRRARKMEKFIA